MIVIGQEGYVTLPARILNSKHSFKVSLRLDRVGMFRVPRICLQTILLGYTMCVSIAIVA